ncbi:MAG: hypothetical protein RIR11_2025 [Bacteroidota bacterium]|jgi:hypothetical protein
MAVFPVYYWHKGIGRYIGFYRQFTTRFLLFLCEKVSFLGVKKLVVNVLCKKQNGRSGFCYFCRYLEQTIKHHTKLATTQL